MLKKNNIDLIISNINDSEVFRKYFGEFEFGKCYPSIFRKDSNPSTGFYVNSSGRIIYNDLTTGEKLTSISFVMKLYDLPFVKAVELIGIDLEIIDNNGSLNTLKKKIYNNEKLERERSEIYIIPRDFTPRDLGYFSSYNIRREQLEKNNVHSVKKMLINGKFISTFDDDVRIAYRMQTALETTFKVYSPNAKRYKWINSIPINQPFGLNSLADNGDKLIITKSLKDKMVLDNHFENVIALQNESPASLPDDMALDLKSRFNNIYINFDCDSPGKKASEYYENTYGFIPMRLPDKAYKEYKLKDYSDFIKKFGEDTLIKLIKWQNL
jgi:hypothetical protein